MRLSGVYRMIEGVAYPSSVLSSFLPWNVDFKAARFRFNLGGRRDRCSIGVVHGVVQNRFRGIPNPSRSSRLG